MTMTPRERIEAAHRHEEPDRTPCFEYVLRSPVADAILGRPYVGDRDELPRYIKEMGWEAAVHQAAVDLLDLAQRLEHDMLFVPANPGPPADGPPAPLPEMPDRDADPVAFVRRQCDLGEADLQPTRDEPFLVHRVLLEEMDRRGLDLPMMAPACSHGIWTNTALMQTMALEPETAHRHFALATRRALDLAERYRQLGIRQVLVGGDFAGNRPLISPTMYREFIVPEVRQVSRAVHAFDGWAVNASDGNLWSVLDDFLDGCEADGYCEIDLHAGMDLGELKARAGKRITFYGNLDCGNTLSFGSVEVVRNHVTECLVKGAGGGGHILCASNAITAGIPLCNYLAVVDAYRDFFSLPPILDHLER